MIQNIDMVSRVKKDKVMYQLKKDYKYVIYGAAFMGDFMEQGLRKAGYQVSAFLDKRADKLQMLNGIRIYHPDKFKDDDKDNTVVIVAITNPFEHPMVARYLVDKGYKKVIYKMSSDDRYQAEYAHNLFEIYEQILEGKISENTAVFEYADDFKNVYFEESMVVNKSDSEVVVYVPLELCFGGVGNNILISEEDKKQNPDVVDTFDKPILYAERWVINLFRAFEGYGDVGKTIEEFKEYLYRNPWRYYSFLRTKQGMDDLITNRYTLFMQLSQSLNSGMDFYEKTPIEAKWNDKGYFNIPDGVHRVCFFIAKGLTRIPAKMSYIDYEKWINKEKLERCIEYLQRHNCPPAYTPIPHPYFYNYPTYRDVAGIIRVQRIFEYLKCKGMDVKGKKVLEIGSYYSYFSQFFYKMGANVTTVELLKDSYELGKKFNELLYCDNITSLLGDIEDIELSEDYDITVMLTVVYPYIGTDKGKAIMEKIGNVTTNMLLWESGEEPNVEINFILMTGHFSRYEKIAETYGTGKTRELGVFYK